MKLPPVQCRRTFLTDIQKAFVDSNSFETLWVGKSCSGFTTAVVESALRDVAQPRFAGVIVDTSGNRNSVTEAMRLRLRGHDVTWCARTGTWRFPSGSTILMRTLRDVRRDALRSYMFTYVAIDGMHMLDVSTYYDIVSRVRVADAGVTPRMQVTGNPYAMDGEWVDCMRDRWVRVAGVSGLFTRERVITRTDSYGRKVADVLAGGQPVK